MKDKVVLAYSGGLDTTVAIKWLQEKYNLDVVAVAINVGQGKELMEVRDRAIEAGALESLVIDAREEFAHNFVLPALQANALYEGKYPLVSALSRPLIAKHIIEVAKSKGANFVAHGCTGKGNDQVRFEVSFAALAPEIEVLAPVREWGMSREETIDYARSRKLPITVTKKSLYSIDENLWGRTIECGVLEDPWQEPPKEIFVRTAEPDSTPDKAEYIEIEFLKGVPVGLNGSKKSMVEILESLDEIGGRHGFGRIDMVENRLVGIKSREMYEVPGAMALIKAHCDLEDLTLERELLHYKSLIEQKYAELVYYGLWYSPLKKALDAFIEETQQDVEGTVRLRFYKGSCEVSGRKSEKSLYDRSLATYEVGDEFSHKSAEGFVKLWGLPVKVWAQKKKAEAGRKRQASE